KSGHYQKFGKYSPAKLALVSLVVFILACSSLLTWYGAWHLIRCMKGMSYLPDIVAATLAGLFAWSSAGASFGRIYQDLYQLLFNYFSAHFCFDSFNDHEKLDIGKLQQHCAAKAKPALAIKSKAAITPYRQHKLDLNEAVLKPNKEISHKHSVRYR
ncbi:MAG TPA: hypothetical protein PLD88_15415, partial [Candidatus Berkiella sp.]|nr:hypothetical protein [Candidatus Berkiella sp.]